MEAYGMVRERCGATSRGTVALLGAVTGTSCIEKLFNGLSVDGPLRLNFVKAVADNCQNNGHAAAQFRDRGRNRRAIGRKGVSVFGLLDRRELAATLLQYVSAWIHALLSLHILSSHSAMEIPHA